MSSPPYPDNRRRLERAAIGIPYTNDPPLELLSRRLSRRAEGYAASHPTDECGVDPLSQDTYPHCTRQTNPRADISRPPSDASFARLDSSYIDPRLLENRPLSAPQNDAQLSFGFEASGSFHLQNCSSRSSSEFPVVPEHLKTFASESFTTGQSNSSISSGGWDLGTQSTRTEDVGDREHLLSPAGTPATPQTIHASSSKPKTRPQPRKPYGPEKLDKVNGIRQISACIRCRALKIECSDGWPCHKCIEVASSAKIYTMPCFRGHVTDIPIYRTVAVLFPTDEARKISKSNWVPQSQKTINIYSSVVNGVSDYPGPSPALTVICQEFTPEKHHPLSKKWTCRGEIRGLKMKPFAIPDREIKKVSTALDRLLESHKDTLLSILAQESDELVRRTLIEAIRQSVASPMIERALKIYLITRLMSKSFRLTGKETLGISRVTDESSPYVNTIPIPPMLDGQLDRIWMDKSRSLKKQLLRNLDSRMSDTKNKTRNWLEIFLTIFVLIFNLEFLYKNSKVQVERYSRERFGAAPSPSYKMMGGWKYASDNLVAHFHILCQGSLPFQKDWNDCGNVQAFGIDHETKDYLTTLQGLLMEKGADLRQRIKSAQPTVGSPLPWVPLAWIAKLFMPEVFFENVTQDN